MHFKTNNGTKGKTVGDPHLGKTFMIGTPPNRRGEREQGQINQFAMEMMEPDLDVVVMMGDIFDKHTVNPMVVYSAYAIIAEASEQNPNTDYILIRGNHDVNRNEETISSFDLLQIMVKGFNNVFVVDDFLSYVTRDGSDAFIFCGYHPSIPADQVVAAGLEAFKDQHGGIYTAAFGHWDVESYGGDDHNLCPYKALGEVTTRIFTGHIHTPDKFWLDLEGRRTDECEKEACIEVNVVGSMQPYSHAEDPDELVYVTRTLDEYEEAIAADPAAFHNNCLRILIGPEDEIPTEVDALQFTVKKVTGEETEEDLQVTMDQFNMKELFYSTFKEFELEDHLINKMWGMFQDAQAT